MAGFPPRWIHLLRWDADGVERAGGVRRARGALVLSLAVNLGLLGFFKYGRFVYDSIDTLARLPPAPPFLAVVVPLGISFYTFHSISYVTLVEQYRASVGSVQARLAGRAGGPEATPPALDERTIEKLRALGYVQ